MINPTLGPGRCVSVDAIERRAAWPCCCSMLPYLSLNFQGYLYLSLLQTDRLQLRTPCSKCSACALVPVQAAVPAPATAVRIVPASVEGIPAPSGEAAPASVSTYKPPPLLPEAVAALMPAGVAPVQTAAGPTIDVAVLQPELAAPKPQQAAAAAPASPPTDTSAPVESAASAEAATLSPSEGVALLRKAPQEIAPLPAALTTVAFCGA